MNIEIQSLTSNLYDKYSLFLLRHEGALFYYSIKYKNFLKDLLNCEENYLTALAEGEIVGILPLMYVDGKFGRVYNSLPFYGSNGGVIADSSEVFDALLESYNNQISEENAASSTVIANPLIEQDYSRIRYDLTDERIGQFTSLKVANPEKELLARFDASARRNVKKATKSGITVEIDNSQVNFLREVHTENMAAMQGNAKSSAFFELFTRYFSPGEDYNIYLATMEGKSIAALLVFYFNKTVEYFIPVTLIDYRTLQPAALIIYRAMVDASQKGFLLWNWGGTWPTQDGVYRFKNKWSTINKNYTYYVKINNQEIYTSSPEVLLEEYGNFYTIPFNALGNTGENDE